MAFGGVAALALLGIGGALASIPDTAPHNLRPHGAHAASGGAGTQTLLAFRGGTQGVMTAPHVFIDFWGAPWSSDPAGEKTLVPAFLGALGGSGDTWSTSTDQYCQGVPAGTVSCAGISGAGFVTHPSASPVVGTWSDTASLPRRITQSALAAEAAAAISRYEQTAGAVPAAQVQVVVATPHKHNASGFGTQYCAWHSSTPTSRYGTIAYTNLPYITDAGASCGANFNGLGPNAGITIVEGHEYAETVTDPVPNGGWLDQSGGENGDKSAWISSGQGASALVSFGSAGSYPVQSLFSNSFSNGQGGCVTSYTSSTNQS